MTFVLGDTPAVVALRMSAEKRARLENEAWSQSLDDQVSALRLTQQEKSKVWAYIKKNRPDLVEFFSNPEVSMLLKQCGAVPRFDRQLIEEALRNSA